MVNRQMFCLATFCLLIMGIAIGTGLKLQDIPYEDLPFEEKELGRTEIFSINISTQIEGQFVLGSGNINSIDYLVVYKLHSDGSKELKKYEASKARIYDTLAPDAQSYILGYSKLIYTRYEIYVPEGTIVQSYDLSLTS